MIDPLRLSLLGRSRTRGASSRTLSTDPAKRCVSHPAFSSVSTLNGTEITFFLVNSVAPLYRFDARGLKKTKFARKAPRQIVGSPGRANRTVNEGRREDRPRPAALSAVVGYRLKPGRILEACFSSSCGAGIGETAILLGNMQCRLYRFDTEWVKKTKMRKPVKPPLRGRFRRPAF
jgi:hypothetical protein